MPENELLEIGRIVRAHGIKGELCIDYHAEDLKMLSGFVFLSGAKLGGPDGPGGPGGLGGPDGPGGPGEHGGPGVPGGPREHRGRGRPGRTATGQPAGPQKYSVRGLRLHKGRPLLTLEGVADRTVAESLRGFSILVPQSRLPELSPDEVYLSELPGLEVFLDQEAGPESFGETFREASGKGEGVAPAEAAAGPIGRPGPEKFLGTLQKVDDVAGQEIWTILTAQGKEVLLPANENFVREINLEENYARISPPPGLLDIYLN